MLLTKSVSMVPSSMPSAKDCANFLNKPFLLIISKILPDTDSFKLCRGLVISYFEKIESVFADSGNIPKKTP